LQSVSPVNGPAPLPFQIVPGTLGVGGGHYKRDEFRDAHTAGFPAGQMIAP